MLLQSLKRPRKGLILLVVLSLLTLFASVGVAFVYFAEQEATKSLDQKAGETIKLPDADILYNYVMKQVVFPTNNNTSALYTQSLLENMYGNTGVVPFSGTGARPRLYRDNRAGVVDPQLTPPTGTYTTNAALIGQDEMFRINRQYRTYNEDLMGSLNPPYTYPDHKNPYLAAVAGNWTDTTGTQHGPVAIARSFAREMKFRIAVIDPAVAAPAPNVVRYHDVIINPYTGSDYNFWTTSTLMTNAANERFYVKQLPAAGTPGGLPNPAPLQYAATPGAKPVLAAGQSAIQCDADGNNAFIVLPAASALAHTLRPEPRNNPNFPPPGDLGGDVKNLPPEVKTLVGFNGTTPIFANNDAYWMDLGFPAVPWSNNRRVKPLFAITIVDNDGKVNMNTAGNLRGFDNTNGSYPVSGQGWGPWEVNFRKLYPTNPALAAQMDQEVRQVFGGLQLSQNQYIRGRNGIDPNTGINVDPSTFNTNYWPLLRQAPSYSNYNVDGTIDNNTPPLPNYSFSPAYTLPGQALAYGRFPANNSALEGYSSAAITEWMRNAALRSPLFSSPFALLQPPGNIYSNNAGSTQRSFALQNMEAMYRALDTGSDKIDSDLRRLMPIAFADPRVRWQMTGTSMDLNVPAVAPWYNSNNGDAVMPRTSPPSPPQLALLDANTVRPAGASRQLPWNAPTTAVPPAPGPITQGEFVGLQQPFWRSIFGNTERIDLAKQLPDYPLPVSGTPPVVDPNAHLNMADPMVRAQYLVALHSRQKLADQIFLRLVNLVHPDFTAGPTSVNSPRWLAQLAVNIVDYIDNDDYPTWYQVPTLTINPATNAFVIAPSTANAFNIVWGTELPRVVINEVYCEAVNSDTGPDPMTGSTKATDDYHLRHWVELYNTLNNPPGPFGAWPDGANARLNVNNTSVYRLVITPQTNITNIRNNFNNTMGYPDTTQDNAASKLITNVVTFNPPFNNMTGNVSIPPSDANYSGAGFYLVGPAMQPNQTTGAFPANSYDSPQMQVDKRVARQQGRFQDSIGNRQAILLQRLANPYLPHNPVPEGTPNTNLFTTNAGVVAPEAYDPLLPYNPYITIDYVAHVSPNHAVEHDSGPNGNPDDANGNPLAAGVENRSSIGKLQPYAALNNRPRPGPGPVGQQLWVEQKPDRDLTVAGIDKLQNQVQHTFLRHNSIEVNNPQYGQKPGNGGATPSANVNTIQLPFDWLVHLDRAPVSPAELLHVSGYRAHELTQMFHTVVSVNATLPTAPTTSLVSGNTFRFTGNFIGTFLGIPYTLKMNDLVRVTYTTNPAGTQVDEWVRVNQVDPNHGWFEGDVSNTNAVNQAVSVQIVVPFAHTAPWHRATEYVSIQSSNRLYRLLECVAVRNPGVDIGQVRFTGNTNAIGPVLPDGFSRWLQLLPNAGVAGMPLVTTNDALLGIETGTPANMHLAPGTTYPINQPSYSPFLAPDPPAPNSIYPGRVGDSVVFFAGAPNEYRSMVLEVDWQNNRIRTVLPDSLLPATRQYTIDYAYLAGRQPGKINLNTVWDVNTFMALTDAKPMNAFFYNPPYATPSLPGTDRDNALALLAFQRLYQQRQPGYFSIPRLIGHTGVNNVGEDRPLQGFGTGDVAPDIEIPRQGVGNTLLSDRFQEGPNGYLTAPAAFARTADMTLPVPFEQVGSPLYPTIAAGGPFPNGFAPSERFLNSLFEMYIPQPPMTPNLNGPTYLPDPGLNHPYRRFELLSKVWNNTTVRSNTFSVWVTVGFFEYDESTGLGAELGQINGKNTRHRFFSVVDRTSVDSWLKAWQLHDPQANVNLFANTGIFPTLDPRDMTYPAQAVLSTAFGPIAGPSNPTGNVWQITSIAEHGLTNPFQNMFGRLVEVESVDAGGVVRTERSMLLDPTPATDSYSMNHVYPAQFANQAAIPPRQIFARLTLAHAGVMTVRPVPVPPTVLHWSQLK